MTESVEAWLDRMDQLRYDDGEQALRELFDGVERVPSSLFARFLGVCGSAYRTAGGQLDNAQRCLRAAMWLADELGDQSAMADLLQRQSYVLAHRADFETALKLAVQATGLHMGCGDVASAGKALVDQGVFMGHLGLYPQAIRAHETSLELIAEDDTRNIFVARHALARHYRNLGSAEQALESLKGAVPHAKHLGPWFEAKAVWLHGELLADLGSDSAAEGEFRRVAEIYWERSPLDAALAMVDVVGCRLRQGKSVNEAVEAAVPLVDRLNKNRLAASALVELFRCKTQRITIALLERIRRQLEAAREPRGDPRGLRSD